MKRMTTILWAMFMVVFMASSAMAAIQESRSEEMTENSSCDFAGSVKLTFNQNDYNTMIAHLATNDYVQVTVTLSGTDTPADITAPTLCEDIGVTQGVLGDTLGALGGDLPRERLVILDTIGVEVSDNTDAAGAGPDYAPDVTAYVYGKSGSQKIYIYITSIDPAVSWADENTFPWIKIGLYDEIITTADAFDHDRLTVDTDADTVPDAVDGTMDSYSNGVTFWGDTNGNNILDGAETLVAPLNNDDELSTAICAKVEEFENLMKLTVSINFDPVTISTTGSDNEIGHFVDAGSFTLSECDKTEICADITETIELCPIGDGQGDCPPAGDYCFTAVGDEWPANGPIEVMLSLDTDGVYITGVTVTDANGGAIAGLAGYELSSTGTTAANDLAATAFDECDDYQWKKYLMAFDAVNLGANGMKICVSYVVNPAAAAEGDTVSFGLTASALPCGNLFTKSIDAADLVKCGGTPTTMYFPFVIYNSDVWFTGIVVTNMSAVATDDMEVTFNLTDATGYTASATKDDFAADQAVYVDSVDNIAAMIADDTLADGNGWLEVETNFDADGWAFHTDGTFGAGTLPRVWGTDRF